SLRVQDNASVSLKCGSASYKLVGMAPDDFPPVVPSAQAAWIRLEAKTLREMLAATSFAISHDETRYALNGVLFALAGKDARLVATDGHRLALASRTVGNVGAAVTGIVPRKAVVEIQRVLGAGEEVQIALNSRYVLDAISPIEREQIVLEFKDGLSPGVIRSVEDEGYCCVIMPMRI